MKKLIAALLAAIVVLSGMALADYRPATASPTPAPFGKVHGAVSDATDPSVKLAGVQVSAQGQSTTTDARGNYTLQLMPGSYTLTFEKDGYIRTTADVRITQGGDTQRDCSMSRELSSNEYRVVLTWSSTPQDLDSHLLGATVRGLTYHVYWSDKTPSAANNEAQLDVDDRDGFGPETTTFTVTNNGTYVYYVKDFTNGGTVRAAGLQNSSAKVEVYSGNERVAVYTVPTGRGRYWEIFRIENGALRTIDRIVDTEPTR